MSENHIEIVIEILKSHPYPLHEAISQLEIGIRTGINIIIQRLIESGISPDHQDSCGYTPLHRVAYNHKHQDSENVQYQYQVLVELLKHGANMEIKNSNKETPLQTAVDNNNPEFVKELLKHGANPNHKMNDNLKRTVLHKACSNGDISMVKVLLEHGANVNEIDMVNFTPLHCAIFDEGENKNEIIKELLLNGADVNLKDGENETVIHDSALLEEIPRFVSRTFATMY